MGKQKKHTTRKTALRKLKYSEDARGHARARHAGPTLAAGPSIDAYLKQRMRGNANDGAKMSAFYNDDDQDRCVAYAFNKVDDHALNGIRTTMRVRSDGTLNQIAVRIVEMPGGMKEGYAAKLKEVLVVVDNFGKNNEVIITACPSDSYRA